MTPESRRQSSLLGEYQNWSALQGANKPDFIDYLKTRSPWIFAHHPQDACFREHVWKVNGLYLCKGCVMTAVGFVIGLTAQILTGWLTQFSEEILAVAFIGLLLPTVFSAWLDAPRPIKHLSRFLLGVLMASALILLFATDRWSVRLVIVAVYLTVKTVLEHRRQQKNDQLLQECNRH